MLVKASKFGNLIIQAHRDTNHFYDDNLPYEYHLNLTNKTGKQFKYLIPDIWFWVEDLLWGHDGIEDARLTYNDIIKFALLAGHPREIAVKIAEGVRALTNYSRGRDRNERMPDYIYKEIAETEGATYGKLCDRIANCKHGLITGSTMRKRYLEEQPHFKEMLYPTSMNLQPMWDYLDKILIIDL